MKLPLAIVFLLMSSAQAGAEVCDKEFPNWSPSDGAETPLSYALASITSMPGLFLMALVVAALVTRRRVVALSAFACSGLFALILWSISTETDPTYAIWIASIREGCRASPHVLLLGLVLIATSMLLLAIYAHRNQA